MGQNSDRMIYAEPYREFLLKYAQDLTEMDAPMIAGAIGRCLTKLDAQPTVDAIPVVHAQWVVDDADSGEPNGYPAFIEFHCPICNEPYSLESGEYDWSYGDDIPFKFCHECGTKMDTKDDKK